MSLLKNVIIVGAGGHLGPSILKAFPSDSRFNVSILARKSSTSAFPEGVKFHRVSDNYPASELLEAFRGQDAVVSTIATAHLAHQKTMADAAAKAGVKRFVPSEFGSDTSNEKAMEILPQYFAGKRDAVEYLKTKEKEGLSWSAFVTGPFFELAMSGFMGFNLASSTATIYGQGTGKWSTTTMPSIGLAVKNSLVDPASYANQYVYVDTFTISQNDILAGLETLTARTWTIERLDAEEQKRAGMEKMRAGDFSGAMSLIRYINCVEGHGGNYATYAPTATKKLGLPETTLAKVLGQ